MCERYSIFDNMQHCLRQLSLEHLLVDGDERISPGEAAPSARVGLIRQTEGGLRVEPVKWGWSPFWAAATCQQPINARAATVLSDSFFSALWPSGRALAPASGWFEWLPDPSQPTRLQPFHVKADNDQPLYFAALSEVPTGEERDPRDGFVLITADDSARPLVLTPELAREWLAPSTTRERAAQIVRSGWRPDTDFVWHPLQA